MSCYVCGKDGHKRVNCPERISKIKCKECGNLGHYKNNCPITIEKIRKERLLEKDEELLQKQKLLLQQKIDDEKWFDENIYTSPGKLINDSEIKDIFIKTLSKTFYLQTLQNQNISIYVREDKLSCYNNNSLGRFLNNMLIDDFISFLSKWMIFTNISYDITDDLSKMISKLQEANIVKEIESEKDREFEYKLCNKKVMYSRRHSTDWRSHVHTEYKNLILDEYSKHINGTKYEDNIHKFKGEIYFIYQ